MIQLDHLTKRYAAIAAVEDLCLEVPAGQLFGFLGPNGAGKTTTIRMLAGLVTPTSGRALIDGHDVQQHPRRTKAVCGFIPDRPFLHEKLSGREFLHFSARLYDVPPAQASSRIERMLTLFNATHYADDLIESYSHGMKQRLVMAAALIHRPRVLIVDEPMVGLDPAAARLVKRVFRALCAEGATLFRSTQSLEVAERRCDRIGIINQGRLTAVGTMQELRELAGAGVERLDDVFFSLTGDRDMDDIVTALQEA